MNSGSKTRTGTRSTAGRALDWTCLTWGADNLRSPALSRPPTFLSHLPFPALSPQSRRQMRFLTGAVAAIAALSSIASGEPVPTFEDDPYATRIPLQRRDTDFKNPDGSANLVKLNQEVDRTVL